MRYIRLSRSIMLTQGKSRRTQHAWSSAGWGPSGEPNGACNPTRLRESARTALPKPGVAAAAGVSARPALIGRASGTCSVFRKPPTFARARALQHNPARPRT